MRVVRIHEFGPPAVMKVEDVEAPRPGKGEVLVRVAAAGVGPWDGWIRAGKSVLPQPLPLTLGSDISGTVEAVGEGTAFATGDEIYGVTNERFVGGYAEKAVAQAHMIAKKPQSLSHTDAASVPVVAVTAYQMLFDHGKLAANQRVLIHGAGGSVGGYAVQLARRAGAHVIGTVASDRHAAEHLGAHEILDGTAPFDDAIAPVDLIVDTVGGNVQERSFSVLKKGGTLISAVSPPDAAKAAKYGVTARFILVQVATDPLEKIAAMIDAGGLSARVWKVLPLAEARTAHEIMEGPKVPGRGKIVLSV